MQIQELNKYTQLFDCYGKLLPQKQYDVMDKLLNLDIGESEMAELSNGSRQAIYDAIKKAKKQLVEFESKCEFVKFKTELKEDLRKLKQAKGLEQEIERIITKL